MKKAILNVLTVIAILFFLWVGMSVIDVNRHNNPFSENYQNYAEWNMFELIF